MLPPPRSARQEVKRSVLHTVLEGEGQGKAGILALASGAEFLGVQLRADSC